MRKRIILFNVISLLLIFGAALVAQEVTVKETIQTIDTYPFSDPNLSAVRGIQRKIYPYYNFENYSYDKIPMDWKVVTLENDYIKVLILPEVGGKIYGAIEKSTGNEFIYMNDVLKFRNVAMRGPWTSGGIELNFGSIGHSPWCSSPVDYIVQKNKDGSQSCTIGCMDLSARTQWRVKISLERDKAYFTINTLWYNTQPFNTSYYHWQNGAFKASNDFELIFPGKTVLGHYGESESWPVDEEGRNLALYRNNHFGFHKSYHVLNQLNEHSGGYWHDSNFGFGHWSLYDDLPGQKFWMWSTAREGAIWSKLLSDSDEQYVEVQMGRLYNQANLMSGLVSPFTQYGFEPNKTDKWSGIWFPIKEIGGMSTASSEGAMYVKKEENNISISFNALQELNDKLVVVQNGQIIDEIPILLKPMDVLKQTVTLPERDQEYCIRLASGELEYYSDPEHYSLDRPLTSVNKTDSSSPSVLFLKAEEFYFMRRHKRAEQLYNACLKLDTNYIPALVRLAETCLYRLEYDKTLELANQVLSYSTYHPDANFILGVFYKEQKSFVKAKAAFALAARSSKYCASANLQLAEIYLAEKRYERAILYSNRALDGDQNNIMAMRAKALALRKEGDFDSAELILEHILNLDPLDHFSYYENYLLRKDNKFLDKFHSLIRNEFSTETYLEIAIQYVNMGLNDEAIDVLEIMKEHPVRNYWLAWLYHDTNIEIADEYLNRANEMDTRLVFPFRRETVTVLNWALERQSNWKTCYYLGLIYWNLCRQKDAADLFDVCQNEPEAFWFYLTRAKLNEEIHNEAVVINDFEYAYKIGNDYWLTYLELGKAYLSRNQIKKAEALLKNGYNKYPDNFMIGMKYAASLIKDGQYQQGLSILNGLEVLPFEGATEGHDLFVEAHFLSALERYKKYQYSEALDILDKSKQYPENLGVGAPYNPDTRKQDYLSMLCYQKMNKKDKAKEIKDNIYHYTITHSLDSKKDKNQLFNAFVLWRSDNNDFARKYLTGWIQTFDLNEINVTSRVNNIINWYDSKLNNEINVLDFIQGINKYHF